VRSERPSRSCRRTRNFGGPGKSVDEVYASDYKAYEKQRLEREAADLSSVSEASIANAATNPDMLAKGKAIFTSTCATCHQPDGSGLIGPNLTDNNQKNGSTRMDIYATVRNGVPNTAMVPWGAQLQPAEVLAVSAYVTTLRNHPLPGKAFLLGALCVLGAAPGCELEEDVVEVPVADPLVFRDEVYPILLGDCGFTGCHGNPDRFFAVFGTARARLDPATDLDAPVTPEELAVSYTRARSMLISPDGVKRAPLLRKPLALDDGGVGHKGSDPWGNALFPSKDDPRFQTLAAWALGGGQ
jgi:mono/diheme cytochrome c family protein